MSALGGDPASESAGESCPCFSLAEIQSATNNFDDALVVGKGGFGKVYRGFINNGGTVVAIKRLNPESNQGAEEFWTEVKMLSKLRHTNLVALLGYCSDCQEMILVYEYIARGTLADHLYKRSREESGVGISNLLWEQRVKICIDAALGLDYLHSGTNQSFIHRDVKTTNILIDENWIAKISDFGLSKGTTSHSITHFSTNLKGTFGYLDPDYFFTHRITKKSDVYAFGVVMLEVLCGRLPVDTKLEEEQISLILWAQQSIKKGKLDRIIDPSLSGQISPRCLKYFVELANKCLHKDPKARPTMVEVVGNLKLALASQRIGRPEGFITKVFQGIGLVTKGMDRRLKEEEYSSTSGPSEDLLRQFSIVEIQAATNHFNKLLLIDGSEKVYKGNADIDGRPLVVAIKRFEELTPQHCKEVLAKNIHVHPLLHHAHIVSLIGFCNMGNDLILVYDYMANRSLQDHLKALTWKERLEVCIGAARGLKNLHAGGKHNAIHGNIKPSNILLDENLTAKVTDFMWPKMKTPSSSNTDVSPTKMCYNTFDPEYLMYGKMTQSSDVYAFGVVLFEVLSHKKPPDLFVKSFSEYRGVPIFSLFNNILQSEDISKFIDPDLIGKIAPECLREFVKIILSCLSHQGMRRPSMECVVWSLEKALQLQETWQTPTETGHHLNLSSKYSFSIAQELYRNRAPGYGWTEGPLGAVFVRW